MEANLQITINRAKTPFYREIINSKINSKINFVEIILRSFSRVDDKKLFKIFL